MIQRWLHLALSAAAWGWAQASLAQVPANGATPPPHADSTPVHASATVEVLEDPSQVDDVIARMKRPEVRPAKLPATTSAGTVESLQADRPPLMDDGRFDRDNDRPLTKAEKRAREIERRRRLRLLR